MDGAAFIVLLKLLEELDEGDERNGLGAEDGGNEKDENEEHIG